MTEDKRTPVQKLMAAAKRINKRRQLTAEEEAKADRAMQELDEAEAAGRVGPEMVDIRHRPETDTEKSLKLVAALEYALHLAAPKESENLYAPGWKLPGYLEEALLRFEETMRVAADLAMPRTVVRKAVDDAVKAGAKKNRVPAGGKACAFDVAGEQLGMPALMVEIAYYSKETPTEVEPYPKKRKTPK